MRFSTQQWHIQSLISVEIFMDERYDQLSKFEYYSKIHPQNLR